MRRVGNRLLKLAPTVRCERCGRPLFKVVPVVRDGRLKLYGAERAGVRVAFSSRNTLVFRHEALDACERDLTLRVADL